MSTNVPSDMSSMSMAFDAFTSHDVSDSLVEEHNQSLTQAQNDLLQQHWKSGHSGFQYVQSFYIHWSSFLVLQSQLQRFHVWGCPTFVWALNYKMERGSQNGLLSITWVFPWAILLLIHPLLTSFTTYRLSLLAHNLSCLFCGINLL